MISLETAKKLKEAGLEWEPQIGDWNHHYVFGIGIVTSESPPKVVGENFTFAPRLDQLLSEIEKQSGRYKYELTGSRVYPLSNNLKPKYRITIQTDRVLPFFADSPEEAAAEALIWILEQEGHNVTSDF